MTKQEADALYKRLVDAKLAGTRAPLREGEYEYKFHSNEQAAQLAVAVVLDWLDHERN